MELSQVLVALLLAVVLGAFFYFKKADVGVDEAKRLVADGALLLDVRSRGEFSDGHVSGARNIPHTEIARHVRELGALDRVIIVHCASGMRSALAARTLRSAGFTRVLNLGGYPDSW